MQSRSESGEFPRCDGAERSAEGNLSDLSDGEARNLRIISGLAFYIRDRFGAEELARVADAAGLSIDDFARPNLWIPLASMECMLERARCLFDDDAAFTRACGYR